MSSISKEDSLQEEQKEDDLQEEKKQDDLQEEKKREELEEVYKKEYQPEEVIQNTFITQDKLETLISEKVLIIMLFITGFYSTYDNLNNFMMMTLSFLIILFIYYQYSKVKVVSQKKEK